MVNSYCNCASITPEAGYRPSLSFILNHQPFKSHHLPYQYHQSLSTSQIQPPPQQQHQPPSKKRNVTFSPTCTVVLDTRRRDPVVVTNNNTEDNHDTISKVAAVDPSKAVLYYTKSELSAMHLETKVSCTLSKALLSPEQYQLAKAARLDTIFAPPSLRGLELMIYPTRRKNKYLAIRSILKYQAMLNSKTNRSATTKEEENDVLSVETKQLALATASAKLTAWSSLVAAETGRLDALAAYDEALEDCYHYYLVPKNKEEAIVEAVAQSSRAPFLVHKKDTTPDYAAPPLPTATTTYHPTLPRQERRLSRRVTMDKEQPQQQKHTLLKKRKILL